MEMRRANHRSRLALDRHSSHKHLEKEGIVSQHLETVCHDLLGAAPKQEDAFDLELRTGRVTVLVPRSSTATKEVCLDVRL